MEKYRMKEQMTQRWRGPQGNCIRTSESIRKIYDGCLHLSEKKFLT